ncbi:MAG: hypothetical protein ACE5HC_05700 [Candidatus Binatia bacterium]
MRGRRDTTHRFRRMDGFAIPLLSCFPTSGLINGQCGGAAEHCRRGRILTEAGHGKETQKEKQKEA